MEEYSSLIAGMAGGAIASVVSAAAHAFIAWRRERFEAGQAKEQRYDENNSRREAERARARDDFLPSVIAVHTFIDAKETEAAAENGLAILVVPDPDPLVNGWGQVLKELGRVSWQHPEEGVRRAARELFSKIFTAFIEPDQNDPDPTNPSREDLKQWRKGLEELIEAIHV